MSRRAFLTATQGASGASRPVVRPLFAALSLTVGAILLPSLALTGCDKKSAAAPSEPPATTAELWREFSGERAMEHVKAQVAFGPRPSGSPAIVKARQHIVDTLQAAGWEATVQSFEAAPAPGHATVPFANVIGRFGGGKKPAPADSQQIIVCSHYDTKRMPGLTFVGANDAGSSTGALMELARVLAKVPDLASRIELVFFDGEEGIRQIDPDPENGPDGLIGSRHYARDLRVTGRAAQFRAAILWDMIGDADLGITFPADSPPHLVEAFMNAGAALGTKHHLGFYRTSILDDHVPLQSIARIPAIDVIDFEYGVGNLTWHSSGDTLDKLSPDSLQKIGQMTLWVLPRLLAK